MELGLDHQCTIKARNRLPLSQNFTITPDVQLLIDPVLYPQEDRLWVLGLRGRSTL